MYKFQKDQPKNHNDHDSESILYVHDDEYYEESDFENNDLQKERTKFQNEEDSESINSYEDDIESLSYEDDEDEYYEESDFENKDLQKKQPKFENEEDSESVNSYEDDEDDDDYFKEIDFENNEFQKDQPEVQYYDDCETILYEDVDDVYCEELDFENMDEVYDDEQYLIPYTPPPSTPVFQLGSTPNPKLNPYFRERLTNLIRRSTCTWSDVELIDYVLDNHGNIKEVLRIELMSFREQLIDQI